MAKLGDEFVKIFRELAEKDSVNMNQLGDFARRLSVVELYALQGQTMLSAPNQLNPDILAQSEPFTTLPHEAASLRFNAQNVSTGTTFGTLTTADPSGATWAHGMTIDISNSKIQVHGTPGESVLCFVLWVSFAASATGQRALQWVDNNGNSVVAYDFAPDATLLSRLNIAHVRRVANTDTEYRLEVWQDTGGDLQVTGLLTVFRVR